MVSAVLGPGAAFGEMPMLGQTMACTYAEAIEETEVAVLSRQDMVGRLVENPAALVKLLEALGGRLQEAEVLIQDLAFKSVPQRLASLLLRLHEEFGPDLHFTHERLASRIGSARETTTQALNQLQIRGLVRLGRGRLTILDPQRLALMTHRHRRPTTGQC